MLLDSVAEQYTFGYKLIDGNKQPEESNVQRITVHKEFPISTESHAKSNVNQLIFLFRIARFFRYTCVPPRPGLQQNGL